MKHNSKTKKLRKAQENHIEQGKAARPTKGTKKRQTKQKSKKKLKTLPNTLNISSLP
jgi:hypothetical protein